MTGITERKRNAQLFSEALIEAFERKYNDALRASADIPLPDENRLTVERRLTEYQSHRRRRTALVAAIAAAVMLLCGCVTYVYREQISDFLLEHTFLRIYVSQETETASVPDTAPNYGLSYVPEGYELVEEKKNAAGARIWTNSESQRIIFSQSSLLSQSSVDNEHTARYTIESDDMTILCFEIEERMYCYKWNYESFNFTILTDEKFADEEILRMIESMTVIE